MKQKRDRLFGLTILSSVALLALVVSVFAESEYDSGTSEAAVNFGPNVKESIVTFIHAESDKEDSDIKIYAADGNKLAPTSNPTNAATVIAVDNTGYLLTTNDLVMYVHEAGTLDYTTVSEATTSNVTLAAGITVAGASGDYLYELTQQFQVGVGYAGTGEGTNDYKNLAGEVFETPSDSPLRIVVDGTANAVVSATVQPK